MYIMPNVCNISSNKKFVNEYVSLVKSISIIANNNEAKKEYLKGLKNLKSKYSKYITDDNFFDSIRDIINISFEIREIMEENEGISQILSHDYNGELSTYDPNYVESTLDIKSKFETIDSTPQEKNEKTAIQEQLLAQYFPMASDSRLSFELRFRNGLIQSFFFNNTDLDNPRININSSDMDNSVKQYRKDLANYLDEYIKENYPRNYRGFKQKTIENKLIFFKNLIDSSQFNVNPIELIKIPVIDSLKDLNLKSKLNAYMAYIALNHFDDMVQQAFGDSIKVLHKGNYKTDEVKYKVNLGNKNAQGWSDQDDDVDETEEIGGVIRLFMESLNLYDVKSEEILPIKMSFSDVKSGLGGIMNLFNSTLKNGELSRNIDLSSYLSANLKEDLEKTGIQNFYGQSWNDIYNTYVEEKTLGQLIAKSKQKPALLMPILFTTLAMYSTQFFNNRYQEKQAVYSIWQNIFNMGNPNSLINRTINSGGINIDSLDLYSFISTLFVNIENIPVIEYRKDEDRISTIGLKQNTSNSKLNAQKYVWAAMYNVETPQQFKSFSIDNFEKESVTTNIRLKNSDLMFQITANDGNVTVVPKFQNGKPISLQQFTPELQEYLSEVLDAKIDQDFYDVFVSLGGELKDLLDIAGTILYNYKVGKVIKQKIDSNTSLDSERKIYDDNIKHYFGENSPNMMRGSMQPELITKSIYPKIRTFSLALDVQQGYSGETTAKDGQGKQISLLGLSSLASKYMEIVYNHNLGNEKSILKDFNIYNSFEQIEFVRDYAGSDNKKQAITFSETEFFEANFLYDFYEGQVSISQQGNYSDLRANNANPYQETKFRIMGPVVSDKSKLPKLRFDWRSTVVLPDGTTKRYLDLTVEDIYNIQQHEFGNYYQSVYNRIHQDYNLIQPYIKQLIKELDPDNNYIVVLDYDNDFQRFNNLCEKLNINPVNILHNAIVNFQKDARLNGTKEDAVKIIQGIHYILGKDKKLHNNPALFHQLSIYGKEVPFKIKQNKKYLPNLDINTINETPEEARERLNQQLVSELMQNDIVLRIGNNDSNTKDSATWAAELFNENGVWRKNKTLIYAKILNGENVEQDILSLRDFQNWKEYKNLVNFLIKNGYTEGDKVQAKYDVTNPKFELDTTLNTINIMKKYNIFRFKEIQDNLVDNYITQNLGQSRSIEEILRQELKERFPKWKEEVLERKIQEQISSMSEEDIKRKKAQYQLNWDINDATLSELNGETSEYFDFDNTLNEYVIPFINSNQDIEEEKLNKIKERIESNINYSIQLNPEIERYQALNNWLGESYQLTSVGTFIAHPGDNNASTIYNYEYRNFGQQVKRNVSHTATKHREVQNSLKGIRQSIRIAIMTDAEDSYITFKGDYGTNVETHNGATFYNGTMVDLDNNSLGADAMGQDKKPFIHAIDPETGIGIIIKTAGFAVANSYIQKSPDAFGRLNKKMNDTIKWTDTLKRYGYSDSYFNWLVDFNNNPLTINPIYVYKDNSWYKRSNFQIDPNTGVTSYLEERVADNGEVLNNRSNGRVNAGIINSNWQLWNVFGGAFSGHLSNGKLSYINDEGSFKLVNYVMNHTGKVVDETVPNWDQTNVIQIVKESQIDMTPTTEAVKFGAANINDVKGMFEDDQYSPTYMEVFSDDMGEQLDAEHTAEGGHVSLMTQVINALGARGYSTSEAEECYEALQLLAEQSFEESFDNLSELNQNKTIEARENFKTAIANIMLQTLKNVSISDGNILSAIAQGLKRFQKFGDYSQLEGTFPISSPQIYANLFSKLASSLEKAAVRLKFDGGMLVLNPSNGIYKIINGKLLGNTKEEEVRNLQANAINNLIRQSSEIQFGHNYYVISKDEKTGQITISEPKLVDKINDFYDLKNHINKGSLIIEAFIEGLSLDKDVNLNIGTEYKPIGRDLATYNCIIKDAKSDRTFSLWDLDIIKQLFAYNQDTGKFDPTKNPQVPLTLMEILWNRYQYGEQEISESLINDLTSLGFSELQIQKLVEFSSIQDALLYELRKLGINEINPNMMHSYLEASLQDTLNSISGGIRKSVIINGEIIKVDKNGTTVSPYEAILPMIYKTTFGLKEGDEVGTIEQDKYFFIKRFAENAKSKFYSESNGEFFVDADEFDLELKRTSGNHIYLAHTSRDLGLNEEIQDFRTEVYGECLYRIDSETEKRMYQIPTKIDKKTGQLVPNCKIYKSSNGVEIIQTDDFSTILEQVNYNSISFGDFEETSDEDLQSILTQLEQSSNIVAQNKAKYVVNAVTKKVNVNREGIQKQNPNYINAIRDNNLQNEYLNAPENFSNISEIFSNNAALNALHHHELYTIDATNQQELLINLINAIETDQRKQDQNESTLKTFLEENPHMKSIVDYGLKQHSSFLASLEAVVSRTPAQSHQSFMAMKCVGFDSNITNSIFVSRMQLYLQGSDFDIDKANVLGLKIDNGILVTWSPYFDLSSKERELASESLPFPSGRSILINDNSENIPWNVISKDYQKIEIENGYAFIDNNGNIIKAISNNNGKSYELEFIPNEEHKNTNTYLLQHAIIKNFGNKKIISNGVLDESVFNLDNGKYTGINVINDYALYLNSLDLSKTGKIFNNLKDLGQLIRTFTSLREIPSDFQDYIDVVNKHNTMFLRKNGSKDKRKDKKKREALYNFISIKTKNISKDPINLIQGQSGIDVATEKVKDLVKPGGKFDRLSSIATTSDNRSILTRMKQLVLTLTGKQNVGIVASAMKVFEAMSHYYYKTLSNGTVEQQERLLSNISILGKKLPLIANSFTKNKDTILSNKVLKAYENVNNFQDAFIMMSALLSLATDNAKDPTLSKLNATPQTLGCYTAGLVLGLTIEEVADLLVSDTGLLLTKMLRTDVFNPSTNQFKNLSDAIKFIRNIPELPKNVDLTDYYKMFGFELDDKGNLTNSPKNSLWTSEGRRRYKQMAIFILNPDRVTIEKDSIKLANRAIKTIENDPHYYKWNSEEEQKYKESTGKEREKYEDKFKEYKRLSELKKSYEAYVNDPESTEAVQAAKEIDSQIELVEKLTSNENQRKLKELRNSTLGEKEALQSIFEWIRYREIVENDSIEINGKKYSRLENIRKLNSFNEEMGDLRNVLKLNQGLPNSVQDQLSWVNNFKGILSRAARRQNRKIKEDSNTPLSDFNNKYGSLDLDLNLFLNDAQYQQDAIRAYESTKIGVNILDVMLNVPHYTGYMKTMNLLYEGGKVVSKNYDTQAKLANTILPELHLKNQEQSEQFFKLLNPIIFEKVNNNFLWQEQVQYNIPKFKIINGELIEQRNEQGELQFESIRLGIKENNNKFKDYCVHYLLPYLKTNYPNNAFVQAITYRTYGYNLDHRVSVNIAKKTSYNINNPQSNVQFNEVKKALGDLNGISGLVDALFYYNLIAYNNQPGAQSLTDLFEDFLVYDNTNNIITEYNKYITYLDESDIDIFDKNELDYLLRVFAPKVYLTDDISGLRYFWIVNPENNKDILMEVVGEPTDEEMQQRLELEEQESQYDNFIDDNDFEFYSKHKSYKTLEEVKKQLNAKLKSSKREVREADVFRGLSSNYQKKFILGKEILQNSQVLDQIITESYKTKTWTDLSEDIKNKLLKKNAKNIFLSINSENISLLDVINNAKSNGWSEQDVLNGFQFVARKSKNHKYDILVTSKLKSTLDLVSKQKEC